MEGKLLSIIVPSYNRGSILPYTLSLWKDQVERHKDDVEFVVCNNASTDNTIEVLTEYQKKFPFFRIVNYTDHVDVGVSIFRSMTDNAKGVYVLNWGDDDVPAPMLLDVIVKELKEHPEINAIVYNRLEGDSWDTAEIANLSVVEDRFVATTRYYADSKIFANEHYREMGFLSVTVVRTKDVIANKQYYSKENLGYEFLVPILCAMKGKPAIYIDFPLCIQRHAWGKRGKNEWLDKYPLYIYVGHPRVLHMLESLGIIENWQSIFNNQRFQKTDDEYYYTIMNRALPHKKMYMPYVDEIISYQTDNKRIQMTKELLLSTGVTHKLLLIKWKYYLRGFTYFLALPLKIFKHVFWGQKK